MYYPNKSRQNRHISQQILKKKNLTKNKKKKNSFKIKKLN